MELKSQLEKLAALLEKHPRVEKEAGLATLAKKLSVALDDCLSKFEIAVTRNTAEYSDLIALLTKAENKSLVTPDWMSKRSPNRRAYAKSGKKEKEEFSLEVVKAGHSDRIIRELKDTPGRQMEDALNEMVLLHDEEVAARFKSMKASYLNKFYECNGIPIGKTAKGAVDKKKTLSNLLSRIEELREYTKLTKVE